MWRIRPRTAVAPHDVADRNTGAPRHWLRAAVAAFIILGACFDTVVADPQVIPSTDMAQSDPVARIAERLLECSTSLRENDRWQLAMIIDEESQQQGYDPLFATALMMVESGCSATARSPRGGVGLLQIRPETARQVARDADLPWNGAHTLIHPEVNVRLGLEYLAQLEERFNDPLIAVAAYNMGPERVARMHPRRARGTSYVRKVLGRYEALVARDNSEWF